MQALLCEKCKWDIVDDRDFVINPKCPECGNRLVVIKGEIEEVLTRISENNKENKGE